ncbi:MAG TPA: MerR family transcriptional regulator, partial [Polyangiales bacterium]|nr:MerR family transcriptional regulator [Polyangiales bacterium]
MTERAPSKQLLSIGALARAIGIPVETLRTWERRYGVPQSERTDTGHRRYSMDTLQKLRLVRAAIQAGHRASLVVSASEAELRGLIENAPTNTPDVRAESDGTSADDELQHAASMAHCIELMQRFDGRALDRELSSGLAALGALRFMEARVSPLLNAVGERWCTGELGVRHEHFASERIQEFLVRHRQPLSDAATGPACVCATPAGEQHTLGLQMAAYTLALNNVRVVYLGANLPVSELASAIEQHAARGALLSAARGTHKESLDEQCQQLRE